MDIRRLVKKEVVSLSAYDAQEIPCSIKLDANESPFDFPGALNAVSAVSTNRYPDPAGKNLRRSISRWIGSEPSNLLLGNGSDELISYLIMTFGGPVVFPQPSFSMYGLIAHALGERRIAVALDKDFDLDEDRMLSTIKKDRPHLIFLSSPNNPTGNCFSAEKVLRIIETSRGIVVVDEAYQPFAGGSGMLPLLKDYKNLVILRTLSKIGLAALRLGFMVADERIIAEVNKVRLPFNINSFSQAVAAAALKDKGLLRRHIRSIVSERSRLYRQMTGIVGVHPYPSEANFILFRTESADTVYQRLLKKGILVRNLGGVADGCLRVTVGTAAENSAFLNALATIMSGGGRSHEKI